jgi:hypothetical protein
MFSALNQSALEDLIRKQAKSEMAMQKVKNETNFKCK